MQTKPAPDVSIVVFAGNEGNALNPCICSVRRAVEYARERGWSVELSMVLWNATGRTLAWVDHFLDSGWKVSRLDGCGLGAARNAGYLGTRGRYVAFADGRDVWSKTWLHAALTAAKHAHAPAVWRPEALITFGGDHFSTEGYSIHFQTAATGSADQAGLLTWNAFPSGFLATRTILDRVPFPLEDAERGWAEVDWWWNCNTVGAGYCHCIVHETFHYRRVLREAAASTAVHDPARSRIGPTALVQTSSTEAPNAGQAENSLAHRGLAIHA